MCSTFTRADDSDKSNVSFAHAMKLNDHVEDEIESAVDTEDSFVMMARG